MKLRNIRTLIVCSLALAVRVNALDLTPSPRAKILEGGVTIPMLTFTHGNQSATYAPPPGWKVNGSPTILEMRPPDLAQAYARISVYPRDARSGSVDDAGAAELAKWAERLIPPEAQGSERGAINVSPFSLGSLVSREFQFVYTIAQQQFSRSVSVVDLSVKERIVVEINSRKKDFDEVREAVIRSLFSWQWVTDAANAP